MNCRYPQIHRGSGLLLGASLIVSGCILSSCGSGESARAGNTGQSAASTATIPAEQVPAAVDRLCRVALTDLIAADQRDTPHHSALPPAYPESAASSTPGQRLERLIELWVLVSGIDHKVSDRFADRGERFAPIIATVTQLRNEVESLARRILPSKDYALINERVHETAASIDVVNDVNAANAASGANLSEVTGPLMGLLSIPLSPFAAFSGVDRSGAALESMAKTGNRAVDISERMPEQLRWESELLLLDLEDMRTVRGAHVDAHQMTQTAQRLATLAEHLPAQVREELVRTLDQTAPSHERLNTTLITTDQALSNLNASAQSLTMLTEHIATLLASVERLRPADPASTATPAPPFDIHAYTDALAAADRTAQSATALVQRAEAVVPLLATAMNTMEASVQRSLKDGETTARRATDEAQAKVTSAIDHIAWRAAQVIGFAALVGAALIVLARRLPRRNQ